MRFLTMMLVSLGAAQLSALPDWYYNYYNLYGDGTMELSGYNSDVLRIELEMSAREF